MGQHGECVLCPPGRVLHELEPTPDVDGLIRLKISGVGWVGPEMQQALFVGACDSDSAPTAEPPSTAACGPRRGMTKRTAVICACCRSAVHQGDFSSAKGIPSAARGPMAPGECGTVPLVRAWVHDSCRVRMAALAHTRLADLGLLQIASREALQSMARDVGDRGAVNRAGVCPALTS